MTRSRILFAALTLVAAGTSQAQYTPPDPAGFEGMIVETYYVSDSSDATDTDGSNDLAETGETTYRVFIDLLPDYKLLTVSGFVNHDLSFNTTTTFFDNDDRGEAWGRDINDAFLDLNTVAIDSWLSMGAASDAHWGVPKSEDTDGSIVGGPPPNNDGGSQAVPGGLLVNYTAAMGVPLTTADGLLLTGTPPPATTSVGTPPTIFSGPGGSSFTSDNFAWGVLGGIVGPTIENKILIGQFTTDGTFTFCLNLWVKIPDSLVCSDPNCHDILEFYGTLLPSDTTGGGFATDNRFTHPTLCFVSSLVDCLGVPGGTALPGTPCDDGNSYTQNDVYDAGCTCLGEDCDGVLGGSALPGAPCDDGNALTTNDTLDTNCLCVGIPVGLEEPVASIVEVMLLPNPVSDILSMHVSGASGSTASYALSDALGRIIVTRDLGLLGGSWYGDLDMSGFTQGVYFLEFTLGAEKRIERITKY